MLNVEDLLYRIPYSFFSSTTLFAYLVIVELAGVVLGNLLADGLRYAGQSHGIRPLHQDKGAFFKEQRHKIFHPRFLIRNLNSLPSPSGRNFWAQKGRLDNRQHGIQNKKCFRKYCTYHENVLVGTYMVQYSTTISTDIYLL